MRCLKTSFKKKRERALKANEELALSMAQRTEQERKHRTGRLMKLGILALQYIDAGDLTLLSRLEESALKQFRKRKIDRLDFELDDAMNWFDKKREDVMLKKTERPRNGEAITKKVASSPLPTYSASAPIPTPSASSRAVVPTAARGAAAPATPSTPNSASSSAASA